MSGEVQLVALSCLVPHFAFGQSCSNLTNPENGFVNQYQNPATEGSSAIFYCDTGYKLSGQQLLQCVSNGTHLNWNYPEPTCPVTDCGSLTAPTNGSMNGNNTLYQAVVTFSCDTGYILNGTNTTTCQANGNWSNPVPTCDAYDCGAPTAPANGTINGSSYLYGSVVTFSCNTGYQHNGSYNTTCQADGNWDNTAPNCTIYECVTLSNITDGSVTVNSTVYLGVATYSCNLGYNMTSGDQVRYCQVPGQWNGTEPNCSRKDCGSLTAPTNGSMNGSSTLYQDIINFSCDTGFVLNGTNTTTCQANGNWSNPVPTCDIFDCGSLSNISGGIVNMTSTEYLGVATYSCNPGFNWTLGNDVRHCLEGGWNGTEANCSRLDCGSLTAPTNGSMNGSNSLYQDVVTFSCDTGFQLNGTNTTTCEASGNWSNPVPTCDILDCGSLTAPTNGSMNGSNSLYQAVVTFSCDTGFQLNGTNTTTCQANGNWSKPVPTCDIFDCGSLSNISGGIVNTTSTEYLGVATYSCNPGFNWTSGDIVRHCLQPGGWNGTEGNCSRKDCGAPVAPANGTINGSSYLYESVVTFSCNTGYQHNGSYNTTCQADGNWDNTAPNCTIYDCGALSLTIAFGYGNGSSSKYEDVYTYTCDNGHRIQGNVSLTTMNVTCTASGNWSDPVPTCVPVDCGALNPPANGQVNTEFGTTFGNSSAYTCNLGYTITNGSNIRVCHSDGQWDNIVPICSIVDCLSLSAINNGSINYSSNTTYSSTATYTCDIGHNMTGNNTRQCTEYGNWTGSAPVCNPYDCGSLNWTLANGNVSTDYNTTYPSSSIYTCNEGYFIAPGETQRVITCNGSGVWDKSVPTCIPVNCGSLASPEGGQIFYFNTSYKAEASITCDIGRFYGTCNKRVCEADGLWTNCSYGCNFTDCGNLTFNASGNVTLTDTKEGFVATYTCHKGYNASSNTTRVCTSNGTWSGVEPSCDPYNCSAPLALGNGSYSGNGTLYGSVIQFSCNTGYYLVGGNTSTCLEGGWDNTAVNCTPVDCGSVNSTISNGIIVISGSTYGATAGYICKETHYVSGTTSRGLVIWCRANGLWDPPEPTHCYHIACDQPQITDGIVNVTSTLLEGVATYSCNHGYNLTSGDEVRRCVEPGVWNNTQPVCERKDCGSRSLSIPLGSVIGAGTLYEDIYTYTCDLGHHLLGNSSITTVNVTCTASGNWSSPVPTCVPIDCGRLVAPTNGTVQDTNHVFSDVASYYCNVGYYISGDQNRTCQSNGQWSGSIPNCTLYDCGALNSPLNGSVVVTGSKYTNLATYKCDTGFNMTSGSKERTCANGGDWSGTKPVCTIIDCGSVNSTITNGSIVISGTTYGEPVKYICKENHYINGTTERGLEIRCRANGLWDPPEPSHCYNIDCGTPASINNGNVVFINGSWYNMTAHYTCARGYYMSSGNAIHICGSNSKWQGTLPVCTKYECGNPPNVSHAEKEVYGTTYLGAVVYTCFNGYNRTSGDRIRFCDHVGVWNGTQPVCERVDCGSPSTAIIYGSVSQTGTQYGDTATYTCDLGFHITGNSSQLNVTVTCLPKAQWSAGPPTCSPADCGALTNPGNGSIDTPGNHIFTSLANFSCFHGYELLGNSSLICQANGQWSSVPPTCRIYDCGNLTYTGQGTVSYTSTVYNSTATYSCHTGYYISSGSPQRTCQHMAIWGGVEPNCTIKDCGYINQTLEHGTTQQTGTTYLQTTTFRCFDNYYIAGTVLPTFTVVCKADGQWSGLTPKCVMIDCNSLTHPNHSSYNSSGSTIYGHNVTYTCNTGYQLTGSSFRQCGGNGNWTGTPPQCTIFNCQSLPAPLHGQVRYSGGTVYLSMAIYTCDDGYNLVSGSKQRVCLEGGWNGTQPSCMQINCLPLVDPAHGSVNISGGFTYNTTATYSCVYGYRLEGNKNRKCQENSLWDGSQPTCVQIECDTLVQPAHGSVTTTQHTYVGSQATYSCERGYSLLGTSNRTCQLNGSWSHTQPICAVMECSILESPSHGHVNMSYGSVYNASATYHCDTGYQLVNGSTLRLCLSNKTWTGSQPKCVIKDCGTISLPQNVLMDSRDTVYGTVVEFRCELGYTMFGNSSTRCQANGWWSTQPPSCLITDCRALPSLEHGGVTVSQTTFGQIAFYRCGDGYELQGNNSRICQIYGTWSGQAPVCTPRYCGQLSAPLHGTVMVGGQWFQASATYSCDDGYQLTGVQSATCGATGSWEPATQPDCSIRKCGPLEAPINGYITAIEGTTFNSTITFSCLPGYYLTSAGVLTCNSTGNWNGPVPQCKIYDCGTLSNITHGIVQTPTGTSVDSKAYYTCMVSHKLSGNSILTCQKNGTWDGIPPTCVIKDCGSVPQLEHGQPLNAAVTTFNSTVIYRCDEGYTFLTSLASITCLNTEQWSTPLPQCTKIDCHTLPDPSFGFVTITNGTKFGSVVEYNCQLGYQINGSSSRQCQFTGNWSESAPTCVIRSCPQLVTPSNGTMQLTSLIYSTVAMFSCFSGYKLFGNNNLTCQATGTWNGVEPTCVITNCDTLNDPQFGHVYSQDTTYGQTAKYECFPGYKLIGVGQRICLPNATWSDQQPSCQPLSCGVLRAPANGYVNTSIGLVYPSRAVYSCNHGYRLSGAVFTDCSESGVWSPFSTPSCDIIKCPTLLVPQNGSVDLTAGLNFSSVATFRCVPGFDLSSNRSLSCGADGNWNGLPPRCNIRVCPIPVAPINGIVEYQDGTEFGRIARYSCVTAYRLQGASQVVCQSNRTWSQPAPTCQLIDCGPLPSPLNGEVFLTGRGLNAQANYSCNAGYRIEGLNPRVCQINSEWSNEAPYCKTSECPQAPSVPFSLMSYPDGRGIGRSVKYTCVPGYRQQGGSASLLCGLNGQWLGEIPVCGVIDCGRWVTINNGYTINPVLTIYKATVTYVCNFGYQLAGNATVMCQMTGNWTQEPRCEPVNCGILPEPGNGTVRLYGGTTYGQTAVYSCNTGFLLLGNALRQCTEARQWSGAEPVCVTNECPELSSLLNGNTSRTGRYPGDVAIYICNEGYTILGTANRLCQLDGTWTDLQPTCVINDCPALVAPSNGSLSLSNGRSYKSIATFGCNFLFQLVNGDEFRICQSDRTWSGTQPECVVKDNIVIRNLTLTQDLSVPDQDDLSDPVVFEMYRQLVYESLMKYYTSLGRTDIVIEITNLQKGSLHISFILKTLEGLLPEIADLTNKLLTDKAKLPINNTDTSTMNVVVGQLQANGTFVQDISGQCSLYTSISPCQPGFVCREINSTNVACVLFWLESPYQWTCGYAYWYPVWSYCRLQL